MREAPYILRRLAVSRLALSGLVCPWVFMTSCVAVQAGPVLECAPEIAHSAMVAAVIDAQTLQLDSGESVRLAGALAPEPPGWWRQASPWPAAQAARAEVRHVALGKSIELRFAPGEARRDRRGRYLAQVIVLGGVRPLWLQERLVGTGYARAYSLAGHRACVRDLQKKEAVARKQRAGLWRDRRYRVWASTQTGALLKRRGSFQVVEGRVVSVTRTRNWTFLNFAADWRTDFTVAIAAGHRKRFENSGVDLAGLEGKAIRARGWIERWNGPAVKATHPEQIEIVEKTVPNMP